MNVVGERNYSPCKTTLGWAVKRGYMCKDEGVGQHWALHWDQWNTAHIVVSHIQQVGPPVQGALQKGKATLLWTLLCLNFSFLEKVTRKEIKWWMWGKLLGRKLGHLCNKDGSQSYQSTNTQHQPLVTQWCDIQSREREDKDLLWELAAGKATAVGNRDEEVI